MISSKAKKLVLAREKLETLEPAELTEVSGGGGYGGGYGYGRKGRKRSCKRSHKRHW